MLIGNPLATLADRMVGSRTIGFIGAGASVRLGLPLWSDLIESLYEFATVHDDSVPKPDSSLDYRWLAEVYSQVISSRDSLQQAMTSIFATYNEKNTRTVAEPDRLHDLIARLPFKHFITTNYDSLIEDACDRMFEAANGRRPSVGERCVTRDGRVSDSFSDFLGAFSQDTQRSVLHLHGTLEGEHLTLSLAEYNDQYLQDAMLLRMFSILATSTVVFIGASLRDADLMELVRRSTHHAGRRLRHYAFITNDRAYEADLLRTNYGIEPIFYSVGEDGSHEELERRLEQLLELVEPRREQPTPMANGNARPVNVRLDDEFEGLVHHVKDEVRRVRGGPAKISGISETALSRVLRRAASDYRQLPISYRFHHVVWISPGRIGLFPGSSRSRRVLHSIIGEIVYSLGRDRLTATSNPMVSIRSIRRVLEGQRWRDAEPILFVIDGYADLIAGSQDDKEAFDELFSFLPHESVALYSRPPLDRSAPDPASRVDPIRGAGGDESLQHDRGVAGTRVADLLDEEEELQPEIRSSVVLAALCLVATPIVAERLALMLDLTLRDLDSALVQLHRLGLIEGDAGAEARSGTPGSRSEPAGGTELRGHLGVLNPIRREVLDEPRLTRELASIASTLLRWAEDTVVGFANWEEDNAQLEQLTHHLPNVLTVFEACCWLTSRDPEIFDQKSVDRHLWLGTDLSYILYNVGRWSEAEQMLEYLRSRSQGKVPNTDFDDAPRPSENHTFLREVLILQSRYLDIAGSTQQQYRLAVDKADEAISDAAQCVREGFEEYEPGANTYAPNRLTLARQKARAKIARGRALLKILEVDEAELELRSVVIDRDFDGPENGDERAAAQRNERKKQRESRLIVADASRALAGVRIAQLERGIEDLTRVFDELDIGQEVIAALKNRRARGHNALRRGDILYKLGNEIAARRHYAGAMLIAIEFRDRFLEAGAVLGLANCDHDPNLARKSLHIYEDLGLDEMTGLASDSEFRLRHDEQAGVSAVFPTVIAVVGVPGSGKSVVTRTAGGVLADWGYEPEIKRDELMDAIRRGEEVDLSQLQEQLIRPLENAFDDDERDTVGIVKIPTGRLAELFQPWVLDRKLLERLLCIRMIANQELLRTRNTQRRSGQLSTEILDTMISDYEKQDPSDLGYSSWESAYEANGGSLVSVDSEGSILALERRVRNALALSYLPYDQLAAFDSTISLR